jgi:hypothetical protein
MIRPPEFSFQSFSPGIFHPFMQQTLDHFILGLPILFLKQYPYAWIGFVALWPYSPSMALIFLAVVVVGVISLRWQAAAWVSQMRAEHAPDDGKFYIDQPPVSWRMAAWKIVLLAAGAALVAFLLQGRLGLGFWQFFLILAGFPIFYQDARFFGASVIYIITAAGIGIRFVPGHLGYQLFLPFREIRQIERKSYRYQERSDTHVFARTREEADGLLLSPKDPRGFSKSVQKLFIVPADVEKFMQQLPYGFGNAV